MIIEAIILAVLCLSFILLAATRWMGYRTLLLLGRDQREFFDEHRAETMVKNAATAEECPGDIADGEPGVPSPQSLSLTDVPEVSVVVVSEGDGALLEANLPYILHQMQEGVEVIVVDVSTADTHTEVSTSDALKRLRRTFPQIRQTYVPATCRNVDRRQAGLTLGIRAARAPWVALTCPDCVPESYEWLSQMLALASGDDVDMVMGYANYDVREGADGVRRAAFERLKRFVFYARSALNGRAVGADGCNILLRRDWFVGNGCFSQTLRTSFDAVSLAVDAHIERGRTALALCPETVVRQQIPDDTRSFDADRAAQFRANRHRSFRGRRLMWRETIGDVGLYGFLLAIVAYVGCRVLRYLPCELDCGMLTSLVPYEAFYRPLWLATDVPVALLLVASCVIPVVVFRSITRMFDVPSFGVYPLCWHLLRPWRAMSVRWQCRKR